MLTRRLRRLTARLLLPRRLERALPTPARAMLERLHGEGHEAWLVGGCVRDLLAGVAPKDWDMVTSAEPTAILELFPGGRVMGARRAGGVTVRVPQAGHPYEVTPYRGANLSEDLARRDFTVNAMALDLDGGLHDPLGGQADLAQGLLRACGSAAERFGEDPLRMLRAVRLAAQFGFRLDVGVVTGMAGAGIEALAGTAPERIGMELGRLLVTARPAWALERLREFGLLAVVVPELLEMVGVEQNEYHAYPVWEHSLLALAATPPDLVLRWAALLHDVGKPRSLSTDAAGRRHFYGHEQIGAEMAAALLEHLRVDGETRRRVVHLVRYHMDLHLGGEASDAVVRRMVRRVGREHLGDLLQLRRADRLAAGMRQGELSHDTVDLVQRIEAVLAGDAALKVSDLAVSGDDVLAAFGEPPGPYVGEVLERLLDEVTEDPARNRREWLLQRLAELSGA